MPFDLRGVMKRSKTGADALFSGLEEIRKQIILEKEALSIVLSQPVDLETATGRLNAWLAKAEASNSVKDLARRFLAGNYREPSPGDAAAVLLASVSSLVRETIRQQMAAEGTPGLSDEERAKKISAHQEAIYRLELAEEAIIREGEHGGLEILRRADADVRAVLADEEEFAQCR